MGRTKLRTQTDQRPFTMIYHDFLESDLLNTSYQKLLYIYLKKFIDAQNQCFPSVKKLAKLTKMSESKVKTTLGELETKGVIKKENRTRVDGGKSSNLYTLYDYKELWSVSSKEDVEKVIDECEDKKLISLLEARGYKVTKENVPETSQTPSKAEEKSDTKQKNYVIEENYKVDEVKSQDVAGEKVEEKYSLEQLKEHYQYESMVEECPEEQETIDKVIGILYESLNTTKKTVRVNKENKSTEVFRSHMMKLTSKGILYAIKRYKEQVTDIPNPTGYIRTLLYNAVNDAHFEEINQKKKQEQQKQGETMPSGQEQSQSQPQPTSYQTRASGMTKSAAAYLSYPQRQYSEEFLNDLEMQLLAVSRL